jgi:site-specific DNA recombinase
MKRCYGYIRVSTARQGEHGVSLQEQRTAIERYAQRNAIEIVEWFEERLTAAKQGRPLFSRMMKLLRSNASDGVVIHKIDRSARNLRDWADLGTLIDLGVNVHFANESVDLRSRGGRLSADIQAVVAADYVRNLREETQKGITGRLRQGLYPFPAPLGYVDNGPGRVKTSDPLRGPLIKEAFRKYATGNYTLDRIATELNQQGVRTNRGSRIVRQHLSVAFSNPFYIGLMRVATTGQTYDGTHQPLVSTSVFRAVQDVLAGRLRSTGWKDEFLLRGLFRCSLCDRLVTGERQKGHVYYRCHTKGCPTKCFREAQLEEALLSSWPPIARTDREKREIQERLERMLAEGRAALASGRSELEMKLGSTKARLDRLTDALVDGHLDRESFETRKTSLLEEQRELREALAAAGTESEAGAIREMFELAFTAQQGYKHAGPAEKREMVIKLSSNRTVAGKNVVVEPHPALQTLLDRHSCS